MFAAMVLYVVVSEKAQHDLIHMNVKFVAGLAIVGAILVGIGFYVQVKMLRPAMEVLQSKPGDVQSLSDLRSGSLACYILAEAVVLFGLCLRFLGGTRDLAIPFYAIGILLMLFWFPRRP
ncbi:MAG TPA: hypothetical protein VMB02_00740 [Candidatus Aquilonibacter sp.]|nr:hypothetical protein [Candidatus Aquilonibacter sp.]